MASGPNVPHGFSSTPMQAPVPASSAASLTRPALTPLHIPPSFSSTTHNFGTLTVDTILPSHSRIPLPHCPALQVDINLVGLLRYPHLSNVPERHLVVAMQRFRILKSGRPRMMKATRRKRRRLEACTSLRAAGLTLLAYTIATGLTGMQ
jgi:hypothetical protein